MCIRNPSASVHATAALINTNNLTEEKYQPLLSVLTKHTTPPAAHAGVKQLSGNGRYYGPNSSENTTTAVLLSNPSGRSKMKKHIIARNKINSSERQKGNEM